jgi:hypothetical protein
VAFYALQSVHSWRTIKIKAEKRAPGGEDLNRRLSEPRGGVPMLDVLPMSQTALVKWHSYTREQQSLLSRDLLEAISNPGQALSIQKVAEVIVRVTSGMKIVEVRLVEHKEGMYALASLDGRAACVLDMFTRQEMASCYTH